MIWFFISSLREVNQPKAWSYTESCNFRSSVNSSPSAWTHMNIYGQCGRLVILLFSLSLALTHPPAHTHTIYFWIWTFVLRLQKSLYTFLSSKYSILAVWYPSLWPWLSALKRAMPMVSTTERPSGKNLTSLTSSIQPWSANLLTTHLRYLTPCQDVIHFISTSFWLGPKAVKVYALNPILNFCAACHMLCSTEVGYSEPLHTPPRELMWLPPNSVNTMPRHWGC